MPENTDSQKSEISKIIDNPFVITQNFTHLTTTLPQTLSQEEQVIKDRKTKITELVNAQLNRLPLQKINKEQMWVLVNQIVSYEKVLPQELNKYIEIVVDASKPLLGKNHLYLHHKLYNIIHSSESLDTAKTYKTLISSWKNTLMPDNLTDDVFEQRANDCVELIAELSGLKRFPRPEKRSNEEIQSLFHSFMKIYQYAYSLPETYDQNIIHLLTSTAVNTGLNFKDPVYTERVLELFKSVSAVSDTDTLRILMDNIRHYVRIHKLEKQAVEGVQKKLLPAIQKKDSAVEILQKQTNSWGMRQDDFGIADFICQCYMTAIDPLHLNELMMISREIPTSDIAKFEQNRLDGLTLSAPFGALRDFIHDQRPLVHETIQTMVDYYDDKSGSQIKLKNILLKTEGYLASEKRMIPILDKELYDKPIAERKTKLLIKPIDILRRLNKNTQPIETIPPITPDHELNKKISIFMESKKQLNYIPEKPLQEIFTHINNLLQEMVKTNEIGIHPHIINVISWLEHEGCQFVKNLFYEEQLSAYKKKWFHELIKFEQLTMSPRTFDEKQFQQFVDTITQSDMRTAYRLVQERALDDIYHLAKHYKEKGKTERIEALWSGNIIDALIELAADLKPAESIAGEKFRQEDLKPFHERLTGD